MNHPEHLIQLAEAATQTIADELAVEGKLPVHRAEAHEPSALSPGEVGAMIAVSRILDLRNEEEIRRFLRCVEGISARSGESRMSLMVDMCRGEICVTNSWIEDGHLEVRLYIPIELETPDRPRRSQRQL